ncbi:hypothetical protein MTR67_009499, partial [Solanum verrucosum]
RKPFHSQVAPTYCSNKVKGYFTRYMASSTVGAQPSFSTLAISTNEPVVSVDWLHANIRDPDLKVLDASWYMPDEQRNPLQEYQVACIPGALFFDIDGITDRTTNMLQLAIRHAFEIDFITFYDRKALLIYQLPHMLPAEEAFAAAVSALGIENKDGVVVYDGKGIFSAARVWWMFRTFGHDKVWVLDGGLPRWRASGYDVESTAPGDAILKSSAATEAIEKVYQGQMVGPTTFQTKFQPHLVWTLDQVKRNIQDKAYQHIDARSKARFDGVAPEPRKGINSGHVPGSKCIPFPQSLVTPNAALENWQLETAEDSQFPEPKEMATHEGDNYEDAKTIIEGAGNAIKGWAWENMDQLNEVLHKYYQIMDPLKMLDGSQTLLSREELEKKFGQEGISLDKPIVASCGTGVTACILVLGLHRLGKTDIPVYDGSWTEWATQPDTPLSTSER